MVTLAAGLGVPFPVLAGDVDELRSGDVIVDLGGARPRDIAAVLPGAQGTVSRPQRGHVCDPA